MQAYSESAFSAAKELGSDLKRGLDGKALETNAKKYGVNVLKKSGKKSFLKRFFEALSEPTLVILEFAWVITLGVNIGKVVTGIGGADIYECAGILIAILLSAFLTLYMEGRSEKAFELLGKVYDNVSVKAVRNGEIVIVPKEPANMLQRRLLYTEVTRAKKMVIVISVQEAFMTAVRSTLSMSRNTGLVEKLCGIDNRHILTMEEEIIGEINRYM